MKAQTTNGSRTRDGRSTREAILAAAQRLIHVHGYNHTVLDAQRERHCVGGCPLGNLAAELSDVHEGFRTRLASVFAAWRERLTVALHRARRSGDIGAEARPEALADFLVASLEGAILLTKVSKDIAVMEQCVGEMKHYLAQYEAGRGASSRARGPTA